MLRQLVQRLFGGPSRAPLDRAAAEEPAGRRVHGKPYAPRPGAIERARMTEPQRLVADLFVIRVKAYCEAKGYDFANFHGPFLWPANDIEGHRLAATVLGPCDLPGYEVWLMEVASPAGTITAVGDSRGEAKVIAEGMIFPPSR